MEQNQFSNALAIPCIKTQVVDMFLLVSIFQLLENGLTKRYNFVCFFWKFGQKLTRIFMRNKDITWNGLNVWYTCSYNYVKITLFTCSSLKELMDRHGLFTVPIICTPHKRSIYKPDPIPIPIPRNGLRKLFGMRTSDWNHLCAG